MQLPCTSVSHSSPALAPLLPYHRSWYSGAGIYRDVHLIRAKGPFSFDAIGTGAVFPDTNVNPGTGKSFKVQVKADVNYNTTSLVNLDQTGPQAAGRGERNTLALGADNSVVVVHELFPFNGTMAIPEGDPIASATSDAVTMAPGQSKSISLPGDGMEIQGGAVKSWSVREPNLYLLRSTVHQGSASGPACDQMTQTIGFRSIEWPGAGFMLNGERVELRGFSNHNDFGGLGTAMSARVHLYQMQSLRSTGAQFRRQSHNPPDPVQLDVLDRLGVLTWDEQRDYDIKFIEDWVAMLRRDRSHASVTVMSTCNEVECAVTGVANATATISAFKSAQRALDGTRPLSANMDPASTDVQWAFLDVQGFSHQKQELFDEYHQQYPNKAVVASECCSCLTQRGENTKNETSGAFFPVFDGDCLAETLLKSYELDYVSGSLGVWVS